MRMSHRSNSQERIKQVPGTNWLQANVVLWSTSNILDKSHLKKSTLTSKGYVDKFIFGLLTESFF
ncbi:MAG TPA: hypothetical protein DCY12_01300 [Candidatus Atribacteria bacterium]|nr:hypothetical protein [Candidatus Atribacteria bacterium]